MPSETRVRGRVLHGDGSDCINQEVKLFDTHTQNPLAITTTDSIGVWTFTIPYKVGRGPLSVFVKGAHHPLMTLTQEHYA